MDGDPGMDTPRPVETASKADLAALREKVGILEFTIEAQCVDKDDWHEAVARLGALEAAADLRRVPVHWVARAWGVVARITWHVLALTGLFWLIVGMFV